MSNVSLESVQKILHLDVAYPYFPTWEEILEFEVDGVEVKAIATHRWRRKFIQIIEPFEITAWTFEPPLIALGVSMLHRQAALDKKGMTEREDCILRTKNAYLRHVTYLHLKPQIDIAQEEFMSVFRDEMQSLEATDLNVQARVTHEKCELRRKLKADKIGQKELQIALKQLSKEAFDASFPFSDLKRQVEMELGDIKHSMIDQVLSDETKKS